MSLIRSFDPVIGVAPKVMILGSMPGVKSLQAQRYYAHPHNAFWPIMSEIFSVDWALDYADRVEQLRNLPLILWDVLKSCERSGSLDSAIVRDSERVNPLIDLLRQHSGIRLIAFNGGAAQRLFLRHVAKQLSALDLPEMLRLPSTSPAYAAMSRTQKLDAWRQIGRYL